MKKYLFIILVLFGTIQAAQSQVLITILLGDKLNSPNLEFGLEGGINWTQISGMETTAYGNKWNLGFYFDIRIKNQWWLYTGVLVKSDMGVDKLTPGDLTFLNARIYTDYDTGEAISGDYSQKMKYFLVPVMIKYKFENRIYAAAGPQFGLMHKAWVEFDANHDNTDIITKEYNKDMINKIDAGFMLSTGYTFMKSPGVGLGVKYYQGFVNVYKEKSGTHNRSFFLTATIPIGAGEKNKDK
jgi:hypothetical protein